MAYLSGKTLTQLTLLAKGLSATRPKSLFQMISGMGAPLPDISAVTNEFGSFTGLRNDYLFQSIGEKGINEAHFRDLARVLIEPDWNALDLGANLGSHSVLMAKLVPGGQVFSFEPQSLTFSLLQNNLLLNGCGNVHPYRFAISDGDLQVLTMEAFSYAGDSINNGALRVSARRSAGDLTISKRLDDLSLPPIGFIKMDIQGSELKALKGGANLIARDRPFMFIEIEEQHLQSLGTSSKELIEHILGLDYILFRIMTHYPCDHICVPAEKIDAFLAALGTSYSYPLERIEGRRVLLTFARPRDQNYQRLDVIG